MFCPETFILGHFFILRSNRLAAILKNAQKRVSTRSFFGGFFFGHYWDPKEHIPTGFACVAIFIQIGIFKRSLTGLLLIYQTS